MSRRSKTNVAKVWINPSSNFKHLGHHAWDRRSTDASDARYLELADVALRVEKTMVSVSPPDETHGNDSNL
jgi:hypothetical protein